MTRTNWKRPPNLVSLVSLRILFFLVVLVILVGQVSYDKMAILAKKGKIG